MHSRLAQIVGEWNPSPLQAQVLQVAHDSVGMKKSTFAIAKEAGLNPGTVYKWLKQDDGFRTAWDAIPRLMISSEMPGVIQAMVAKAQDGDVPAARLLAEMSQRKLAKKVGCTANTIFAVEHCEGKTVGVSLLDAICCALGIEITLGQGRYIEKKGEKKCHAGPKGAKNQKEQESQKAESNTHGMSWL